MVLMRRFDPVSILAAIDRHRIVGMTMVATMVHMIRELPERLDFDTSSVRWLIFSQVAERLFRDTQVVFPGARLIEGYGLTETCNGIAYLDQAHMETKLGSVGRPVHQVDLAVVDDDDVEIPIGELGEIVVRGPKVSPGYWNDAEATAQAHRNGWFHTGDIGRFDADGYLYVVDRKKDMIRSGGENMASSEIERVLYDHPAVSQAAVVAAPHPKWNEVPVAFVVRRGGEEVSESELVSFCARRLAKFKVPTRIMFLDDLPRNPSGKVLKRELRDQMG
jgi:acyl-CoA synthetase (AMP-forming)/AMP-acid ligase II